MVGIVILGVLVKVVVMWYVVMLLKKNGFESVWICGERMKFREVVVYG